MMVLPSWYNFLISARISAMPTGSKPLVGSSNISTSGLPSRQDAIASLCFMPKE